MPEWSEQQLKKETDAAPLSGLYVLYGEEPYLVSYWAQRLIKKAAGKEFLDFNLQRFAGDVSVDHMADAATALPFLAERKCVAVADLSLEGRSPAELRKLAQLLAEVPGSTVLLFSFASSAPPFRKDKKWKAVYDAFLQNGKCVRFSKRALPDLAKLLCKAAAKRGCSLTRANAERMVRCAGDDLQLLLNELEKLCAYCGAGEISAQTIDTLITRNLEARVFDLSRFLLRAQYERAYNLLDQLLAQNEEPVKILAALSTAYVDLYRARTALESGESVLEPAKYFDYKRKEFRLRNAEQDMRDLSVQMLRDSLDALLEADLSLKGSRTQPRLILEKLLARLLVIAKEAQDT